MLRHIAEKSEQAFEKYTLDDLLKLQDLTPEEQLQHLDTVLHVGISKIILLLQDLPFGFGSVDPIRDVIQDYVQDLRDLFACPPRDPVAYQSCVLGIFTRHRGMLGQIGQGLQDFQDEISKCFIPTEDLDLGPTVCMDVSDTVPAMQKIERNLDDFFTIRTTLRLLIAHCLQLNPEDHGSTLPFAMQELLQQRNNLGNGGESGSTHVGAVCLNTRPSLILLEAYKHVHFMCERRFKRAPNLLVNGVPAEEFLTQDTDHKSGETTHFPYVDVHLYFIFFEVLKEAMITSIRSAGPDQEPPAVHASLLTGTSLSEENERVVKITDSGEGINRYDIRGLWCYFPKVEKPTRELDSGPTSSDLSLEQPSGRGLGLAVSRVLVRYFGGEMTLQSIARKGTDVYIYL